MSFVLFIFSKDFFWVVEKSCHLQTGDIFPLPLYMPFSYHIARTSIYNTVLSKWEWASLVYSWQVFHLSQKSIMLTVHILKSKYSLSGLYTSLYTFIEFLSWMSIKLCQMFFCINVYDHMVFPSFVYFWWITVVSFWLPNLPLNESTLDHSTWLFLSIDEFYFLIVCEEFYCLKPWELLVCSFLCL